MRVIAGTKKGLPLKTLEGDSTRPTNDRIKETLFNMISFDVPSSRFLDLFSGSGQIAIEALSRGALAATLVESNPKASKIIENNIKFTGFNDSASLITADVFSALKDKKLKNNAPFDIIFMDPPYKMEREAEILTLIKENELLSDDGMIIIEADISRDFSFAEDIGFSINKVKQYKTNQHVFLGIK